LTGYSDFNYHDLPSKSREKLRNLYRNPSSYEEISKSIIQEKRFDFTGFDCDFVAIEDIEKWEDMNGIGVTVFKNKGKHVYPVKSLRPNIEFSSVIDLLLLSNEVANHYTCITDLGKCVI
jgi:hypothetical protein